MKYIIKFTRFNPSFAKPEPRVSKFPYSKKKENNRANIAEYIILRKSFCFKKESKAFVIFCM